MGSNFSKTPQSNAVEEKTAGKSQLDNQDYDEKMELIDLHDAQIDHAESNLVKVNRSFGNLSPKEDVASGAPSHQVIWLPHKRKQDTLAYLLRSRFAGVSTIVYVRTVENLVALYHALRPFKLHPIAICGRLPLSARLDAMKAFQWDRGSVLISTESGLEGLADMVVSSFDIVINFDIPMNLEKYNDHFKDLVMAGQDGHIISMVSQYDIDLWDRMDPKRRATDYKVEQREFGRWLSAWGAAHEARMRWRQAMRELMQERIAACPFRKGRS